MWINTCNKLSLHQRPLFRRAKMEDEAITPDLRRELFARFGSAYYHSECLHKELSNFLALSVFSGRNGITRPRIEERSAHAFSLSLGVVLDELRPLLSQGLLTGLEEAVKKRNFLAHYFWFERAHLMFTVPGIERMIEELDEMYAFFHELDEKCTQRFVQKRRELGITDEAVQSALDEGLSGEPMQPLLSQRKLKKQERIVRAWEFTLPDGRIPLVFETEDGCLWQLCDVGLGWTYYDSVKDNWRENNVISRYLPATLNPRPLGSDSWHYELKLSKGAVLWVRPGSRERTFKWGIRTKS